MEIKDNVKSLIRKDQSIKSRAKIIEKQNQS